MDLSKLNIIELVISYGMPILAGIFLLLIGWFIIGIILKGINKVLNRNKLDDTLKPLILSTCSILLKAMLLLAVASTMGIKTTSFVAILASAGVAIGLALQGSLANLAGGFLLIFFRPFRVGDYIKAQGQEGFVKAIQLFTTILETPDNMTIYLPNGPLSSGDIVNVSENGTIRLHLGIGIGYDDDIKKARNVLMQAMKSNSLVLKNPEPAVAVTNLGDSSVDLTMRPWCNAIDAPTVTVEILEAAKIALDEAGIEIPYPQQVVYMTQSPS